MGNRTSAPRPSNEPTLCRKRARLTHGPETFLARRVPELQPDLAPVHHEALGEEARANGGRERVAEVSRGVPMHDRCLADSLAANCNQKRESERSGSEMRGGRGGSGRRSGTQERRPR